MYFLCAKLNAIEVKENHFSSSLKTNNYLTDHSKTQILLIVIPGRGIGQGIHRVNLLRDYSMELARLNQSRR